MKQTVLSLLFSLCALVAQGQSLTVKGVALDSMTGQPEAYATVRLLPEAARAGGKAAKPVAVAASRTDGTFELRAPRAGRYVLSVSSVGKRVESRPVSLSAAQPVADVGRVLLEDAGALGEATVTAIRPLVSAEVDRVGYSMADDPEAKTSTMLDMLRKVPLVTVDGDDQIKVNGKTSFKVYVNGRPNEMLSQRPSEIFKSYPAATVKKIEVITDPGAKYDAEGVAGILNIVTEQDAKMSGYLLQPNVQVSQNGVSGGLYAMTQVGRLTLSATYGAGSMKQRKTRQSTEREMYAEELNHLLRSSYKASPDVFFQYGNLQGSYEFSERDLLTVGAGLMGFNFDTSVPGSFEMLTRQGTRYYGYDTNFSWRLRNINVNASADYQHTFRPDGPALTLSYRLNTAPSRQTTANDYTAPEPLPFEQTDLRTNVRTASQEHTLQADYTMPLGKAHKLSVGAKQIMRANNSNSREFWRPMEQTHEDDYQLQPDNSLRYRHRNNITAAYGEYNLKLSKLSARAGLRYEYSDVHVSYPDASQGRENFKATFSDLVPNLSLGLNLKPTELIKMSYSSRIGRPGIDMLSPYVNRQWSLEQSYGKPDLESETAHNFSLGYNRFTPKLSLSANLTYSLQTNGLVSYSFMQDAVKHTTYGNFLHSKQTSLNGFVNWSMTKTTSVNLNLSGSYSDFKSYRTQEHRAGWDYFAYASLTQQLPWKLKWRVSGGGGNGGYSLQGKQGGFHFYHTQLARSFLKDDRLTLTVGASQFLEGTRHFRQVTQTAQFRSEDNQSQQAWQLSVGVSFRLGSLRAQVKQASRTIENDDVVSGKSQGGLGGVSGGQGGQSQGQSGGM